MLEEIDWHGKTILDPAWTEIMDAYRHATTTMDWACGRELIPELTAAGLQVIDADAEIDAIQGACVCAFAGVGRWG